MRFNDKEIAKVGESRPDLEGILHHLKPSENDWSDWYQQPTLKERTFKLVSNLLFYYRVNEPDPLGVFVLENYQVAYERPHKGIPFSFSLTFKINDRSRGDDRKHIFSCRCEEDVNKWVNALKTASYEHWRSQYIILKAKISMRTGQSPDPNYITQTNVSVKSITKQNCGKRSTFYSGLDIDSSAASKSNSETLVSEPINVGKLIDL